MTYFILNESETKTQGNNDHKLLFLVESYKKIISYADFLKQSLTLGMFVPCDLDGNVLEDTYSTKPDRDDYFNEYGGNPELYQHNMLHWRKYQEAKDRVLFEEFEYKKESKQLNNDSKVFLFFNNISCEVYFEGKTEHLFTVEELVKYNLVLTQSAKKQIGL